MMNNHWKKTLFFALLSGLSFVLTHLWYDHHQVKFKNDNKTPIGYIKQKEENVLRKAVSKLLWKPADEGEQVFSGEAIKTSKDANCIIEFTTGGNLELEANSMIVLNQKESELDLELLDGKILVQNKGKMSLKSGNQSITLDNAKVILDKNDDQTKLQVLKGTALDVGSNTTINQGQSLIEEKGKTEVKEPLITAIEPHDTQIFYKIKETVKVKFTWVTKEKSAIFKLYKDGNLIENKEVKTTEFSKELPPGEFSWQVEVKDKEVSERADFEIKQVVGASPLFPEKDFKISSQETIKFIWTEPIESKVVSLELSSDDKFTKPEVHDLANSFEKNLSLGVGKYWWRLRSKSVDGQDVLSGASSLEVVPPPVDIKMVLVTPEKEELYYEESPSAEILWDSPQKDLVKKWKIEVIQDSKNKEYFSSSNRIKIKFNNSQDAIVKVSPAPDKSNQKLNGELSFKVKLIKLEKIEDLSFSKKVYQALDGNTKVSWSFNSTAKDCVVEIYKNQTKVSEPTCESNQVVVQDLSPGKYKVYVKIKDIYQRTVPMRAPAEIVVPEISSVKPPKIQKIGVKHE